MARVYMERSLTIKLGLRSLIVVFPGNNFIILLHNSRKHLNCTNSDWTNQNTFQESVLGGITSRCPKLSLKIVVRVKQCEGVNSGRVSTT